MEKNSVKMIEAAKHSLMSYAPASLRHIPDGTKPDGKWYQAVLGFCHVWLWNFPRGFLYHSDVFKEMMPDRLMAEVKTPVVVTTFFTTANGGRTCRISNVSPEDCDFIKVSKYDNAYWYQCKDEPNGMKISDAAEHTASIPFLFKTNKWKWGEGRGHATLDGCTSQGFLSSCIDDDCIIFVGTYDWPSMDMPKAPKLNWAALPWIGIVVKAVQAIGGMINDNCFDDMLFVKEEENRLKEEANRLLDQNPELNREKFVSSFMMPCESTRERMDLPARFDFAKHTPDVVSKLYDTGLAWAEKHWSEELTSRQKVLMAKKGCTMVGMGGACNGIFQAGFYAYIYERLKDLKEALTSRGEECQTRVFNLLTGDSCGGISACFFANLQDLDEAGKLHLVMKDL